MKSSGRFVQQNEQKKKRLRGHCLQVQFLLNTAEIVAGQYSYHEDSRISKIKIITEVQQIIDEIRDDAKTQKKLSGGEWLDRGMVLYQELSRLSRIERI